MKDLCERILKLKNEVCRTFLRGDDFGPLLESFASEILAPLELRIKELEKQLGDCHFDWGKKAATIRIDALEEAAANLNKEAAGFDYNSKNSPWAKLLREKAMGIRTLALAVVKSEEKSNG